MPTELEFDELRDLARRAGLNLAEDELQRLLPGVIRARKQATELHDIVVHEDEPAGAFDATSHRRK